MSFYTAAALLAVLLLLGRALYNAIWSVYLGPLSLIPGPRLAALTRLYETFYDICLGGQYTFKIIELHKKYGPIIRIAPGELHISDPDFYDTIYASSSASRHVDKDPLFTRFSGLDNCVFSTIQHELHSQRRAALSLYFSMANVRRLQPVIQERLGVMMRRIDDFRDSNEVLNVSCMFSALGNDVVNIYSFARCDHKLESPNFDPSSRDGALAGLRSIHWVKHVPWIHGVVKALPGTVVRRIQPALAEFLAQQRISRLQVEGIMTGKNEGWRDREHQTIFHAVLDSKHLPQHEKTAERLSEEAQVLVMAGTLTTATILELITFWLLRQPETLLRLKQELRSAMPSATPADMDAIPLAALQALPYLMAVIKEGLRLGYGLSTRSQRINPDNSIMFVDRKTGKRTVIPPNTPVSITSVAVHRDETIFPQPELFIPDRWLGEEAKKLDRYLTSFSRGSRNCLGMNLAYGELHLTLAYIWRVWASREARGPDDVGVLELFETGPRDVEMGADYFIPTPQRGSMGIRVKVYSA
ncbi:cytochrome P450 [Hypoxylon cercidicola]|nr:cytochrome P450 [Hypoxylon cercidicola]